MNKLKLMLLLFALIGFGVSCNSDINNEENEMEESENLPCGNSDGVVSCEFQGSTITNVCTNKSYITSALHEYKHNLTIYDISIADVTTGLFEDRCSISLNINDSLTTGCFTLLNEQLKFNGAAIAGLMHLSVWKDYYGAEDEKGNYGPFPNAKTTLCFTEVNIDQQIYKGTFEAELRDGTDENGTVATVENGIIDVE